MIISSSAGSSPVTTGDYQPGDVLGSKYTVRELLGRGTTGATYKVRHMPFVLCLAVLILSGCYNGWPIPAVCRQVQWCTQAACLHAANTASTPLVLLRHTLGPCLLARAR